MRRALRLMAILSVLTLGQTVDELHAQTRTTSGIRGTVLRADGTPVIDAALRLRHTETGTERLATTNDEGRFLLSLLPPGGPYTLTLSFLGFADLERAGLVLQVGETRVLELLMSEQAIEVEGIDVAVDRSEIFNPGQVGPATLLDERTVESMPILSRNLMDLAVLSPLVKATEDGGFSVAGQNDRYNAILVDGILNKDVFGLTAGGVPGGQAGAKLIPLDAVSQYEILVAPFDVRLSGFTGGVMNAVTRTGTNDWRLRGFAVGRDEVLMGDLSLPTGPAEASGVDRSLFGLSVGGPIIRDKAHFFVTGEFETRHQPPTGFNLGRDDPLLVRVSPEAAGAFQDLFQDVFDLETGTPDAYPLGQELANVFARVDWNFGGGNRLTVRNVFARAINDQTPNRSAFEPYEFASNAVFRTSTNNTTSVQLFSDFGNRGANELNLSVTRTSDETAPASLWPQIEAELVSSIAGSSFRRGVRAGSQFFAQENDLDQTAIRLTNSVTLLKAGTGSAYTLGVTGAYYDINHRFLPGAAGEYFFASMGDLELNAPQRFQRTVLAEGLDPTVNFSIAEWGAFVQNEIDAGKGLTMRFGLRMDVPYVLDKPEENPEVLDLFGRSTADVPSGTVLLSPRWGFNWQSEGERTTQVRGGLGFFVGQLPFAWLSNAFHNNGMRSVTQVCQGRLTDDPPTGNTVPAFDPLSPPTSCVRGPFTELRTVTLFDDGFKYPQDIKFSVVVDREITSRVSASLGFLFNHARNQVSLEELNLGDPSGNQGPLDGYGGFERRRFGHMTGTGFAPNREYPQFDQVLVAKNEDEDFAYSVTAELRGSLTDRLSFQTGYSYARSFDRMSLTFTDMISNYGFNPARVDPNNPQVTTSNFDRPHKIVLAVYGAPFPGLEDTEISLLYTGQSGLPFSYVYRGDINGDGYPGLGAAFDRTNDLIYVPNTATELPAGFATLALLEDALENDECLAKNRGRVLNRNACRAPWQNRLDVRISQELRLGRANVRLEGDMINVLNFINSDWGKIESIRPVVSLLEPIDRREGSGELISQWAGAVLPSRTEEGRIEATDPWTVISPDSQWQAQFGVRVTFGGDPGR